MDVRGVTGQKNSVLHIEDRSDALGHGVDGKPIDIVPDKFKGMEYFVNRVGNVFERWLYLAIQLAINAHAVLAINIFARNQPDSAMFACDYTEMCSLSVEMAIAICCTNVSFFISD